jgi:hypothetical protein
LFMTTKKLLSQREIRLQIQIVYHPANISLAFYLR